MTLYEPALDGSGIFSGGVGKDSPYGKQTAFPRYSMLPRGRGRIGSIVQGAYYVGRYFRKNPRFGARIGAVVTGAGVRHFYGSNARTNKHYQTLRAKGKQFGYKRKSKYNNTHCCCCRRSH